ncbi:uncharacterized protein N7459_005442 [Penicillium hispanicum]|uniref:uncharacterized protein n=1 Tax=Penicillium hispanicum TaxID=1080232 RepID=UPI002541B0A4|nr:uncharacterized protein N7459_005442 [Penicillium hispanicum]KAJ5579457.1 hypothetical protein N7459_005442 [Penicillium hispanicum]
MSDSYTSSAYYYSSTTNTGEGTTTTGHRYSTTSHTDPDGTTIVRTARQDLGQPAIVEERRYDHTGQEQLQLTDSDGTSAGGIRRITDLDEEESGGSYDVGTASHTNDADVGRGAFEYGRTAHGSKVDGTASSVDDTPADAAAGGAMRPSWDPGWSGSGEFRRDVRIWI